MSQRNQLIKEIRERLIRLNPDISLAWLSCLTKKELNGLLLALKADEHDESLICF